MKFGHIEFFSKDVQSLVEFYVQILYFRVVADQQDAVSLKFPEKFFRRFPRVCTQENGMAK